MIIKELRLSRQLSQEQLAIMSGLNVRTIQRIESGKNPSVESLKCIAAALDVSVETLKQESFMLDKKSTGWRALPIFLKLWFLFNFVFKKTKRATVNRLNGISQFFGFCFCVLGLFSEAALVGGLFMLLTSYLYQFLVWQGDKYSIWYDKSERD